VTVPVPSEINAPTNNDDVPTAARETVLVPAFTVSGDGDAAVAPDIAPLITIVFDPADVSIVVFVPATSVIGFEIVIPPAVQVIVPAVTTDDGVERSMPSVTVIESPAIVPMATVPVVAKEAVVIFVENALVVVAREPVASVLKPS